MDFLFESLKQENEPFIHKISQNDKRSSPIMKETSRNIPQNEKKIMQFLSSI